MHGGRVFTFTFPFSTSELTEWVAFFDTEFEFVYITEIDRTDVATTNLLTDGSLAAYKGLAMTSKDTWPWVGHLPDAVASKTYDSASVSFELSSGGVNVKYEIGGNNLTRTSQTTPEQFEGAWFSDYAYAACTGAQDADRDWFVAYFSPSALSTSTGVVQTKYMFGFYPSSANIKESVNSVTERISYTGSLRHEK